MINLDIHIEDYDYKLPDERIAKFPLEERSQSKLLVFSNNEISDSRFSNIADFLKPNSQIIFNKTKVVQARLLFFKSEHTLPIEIFCLEPYDQEIEQAMSTKGSIKYTCLIGRAKKWKSGKLKMDLGTEELYAEKVENLNGSFVVEFQWNNDLTFAEILEIAGKTPLPPYLNRQSEPSDKTRYQTVYAEQAGSVAAPTAGLHFTPDILKELTSKGHTLDYTTLHVGAGTFKPVSSSKITDHDMHFEEIHVKKSFIENLIEHEGPRTAVGTTSVRTLESLYWMGVKILSFGSTKNLELKQWECYQLPQHIDVKTALTALLENLEHDYFNSKTQLMIVPGYQFKMLDSIITNFHQPKSTLLLLVAAATSQKWKSLYDHALNNNYRFLSYGDSSIIHI